MYENSVNCAEFMDTLIICANGRLIGQSASCKKTLWGLVAPHF